MKTRRLPCLLLAFLLIILSAPAGTPCASAAQKKAEALTTDGTGAVTITAVGAYIEYTARETRKYSAVSFNKPVKVKITAQMPRGKTLDHWVINGVRYDFKPRVPVFLTLDSVTESMTVEAVAKGQKGTTLLSADAIQAGRTGEALVVEAVNAKLSHIKPDLSAAGGWMTSFDFTENYRNRATRRNESGGQVTVRVKATVPKGKTISYWKINKVKIDFNRAVTEIVVRSLNVSETFEPVFVKKKQTVSNDPKQKYTVKCIGCTFSGGGYTNASSGEVEAGTQIKLTGSGPVSSWTVNGSTLRKSVKQEIPGVGEVNVQVPITSTSLVRTINSNTAVVCNGTN